MKIKIVKKQLRIRDYDVGWSRLTAKVPLWLRSFEGYTQFDFEYIRPSYKKRLQVDWRRFIKLKRNKNCEVNQDSNNQQLYRLGLWEII
jgi:hypothetical protein